MKETLQFEDQSDEQSYLRSEMAKKKSLIEEQRKEIEVNGAMHIQYACNYD